MQIIYDAYLVFPDGKYRTPLFTNPAKRLTGFLFNLGSTIFVPHFMEGFENKFRLLMLNFIKAILEYA